MEKYSNKTINYDCDSCLWGDKCFESDKDNAEFLQGCNDYSPINETDFDEVIIEENRIEHRREWNSYIGEMNG